MKGSKGLALRGVGLDSAAAVVMGAAFGVAVTALVKTVVAPTITNLLGRSAFSGILFEVNWGNNALRKTGSKTTLTPAARQP